MFAVDIRRINSVTTQGPSWGYLKVNFSDTLSIFGDKCPQNGSKNGLRAPRTGMGCPHIGPSVDKLVIFGACSHGIDAPNIICKHIQVANLVSIKKLHVDSNIPDKDRSVQ